MDILKSSQLVIFSHSTIFTTFPTEVLQVFSSNCYEVRGGENRKWRWIFAFDRCVGKVFYEVDRCSSAAFSIGWRAHVWLTCLKQCRIVQKPVNANPGLKVNRIITFSSALLCAYICYWPAGSSVEGKTVTEILKMLPEAADRGQHFQALFPGLA